VRGLKGGVSGVALRSARKGHLESVMYPVGCKGGKWGSAYLAFSGGARLSMANLGSSSFWGGLRALSWAVGAEGTVRTCGGSPCGCEVGARGGAAGRGGRWGEDVIKKEDGVEGGSLWGGRARPGGMKTSESGACLGGQPAKVRWRFVIMRTEAAFAIDAAEDYSGRGWKGSNKIGLQSYLCTLNLVLL